MNPVADVPLKKRVGASLLALLCLAQMMNAATPHCISLFEFHNESGAAGWRIVNDSVMGGRSTSRFNITPDETALFQGAVSLENNGGFASVRSAPLREGAKTATHFRIRVLGDGKRYRMTVRNGVGSWTPSYQSSFETKAGKWQELELPFDKFSPTFRGRALSGMPPMRLGKGDSIGFTIGNKKAESFRLEIDWIQIVSVR